MVSSLCNEQCDIILTSGQANSIPFALGNLNYFPVRQHPFILGLQPDLIILCINCYDEYTYIENTIKYLEGITSSKVISIVIFAMKYNNDWKKNLNRKSSMISGEILDKISEIKNEFGIPCFILGDHTSMYKLYIEVINYLSEQR